MEEISYKSTKKDIWDAYSDALDTIQGLEKELQRKEQELARLKGAGGTATVVPVQESGAKKEKTATTIIVNNDIMGMQALLEGFTRIESGIAPALNELSFLQIAEAEKIEDLQKLIAKEENSIKELYNIDITEGALVKMMETYLQTKESFEIAYQEKESRYEDELLEIESSWKKEQEQHKEKILLRNAALKQEQEREAEEYKYRREQNKAEQEDIYAQWRKAAERELVALKLQNEEAWAEKEKELAEREADLLYYKTEFEGITSKLDKEIKKAEADAKSLVEREFKMKIKLLQTEAEGEQAALQLRIEDLKKVLERQNELIEKQDRQTEEMQRQVQTLALKALEGTANNDSYKAVREIAIEQAKNMGK